MKYNKKKNAKFFRTFFAHAAVCGICCSSQCQCLFPYTCSPPPSRPLPQCGHLYAPTLSIFNCTWPPCIWCIPLRHFSPISLYFTLFESALRLGRGCGIMAFVSYSSFFYFYKLTHGPSDRLSKSRSLSHYLCLHTVVVRTTLPIAPTI